MTFTVRARPHGRRRRRDRLRQEHPGHPAVPARRPRRGPHRRRRPRPARPRVRAQLAEVGRAGAAAGLPLRRHRPRQRDPRRRRVRRGGLGGAAHRAGRRVRRRPPRRPRHPARGARHDPLRRSAAAALAWPAPSCAGRGCSCMDDATSAVDPEVEARILAALRDASAGATVRRRRLPQGHDRARRRGRLPRRRPGRRPGHRTPTLLRRNPAYADLVNAYERDAGASGAADGRQRGRAGRRRRPACSAARARPPGRPCAAAWRCRRSWCDGIGFTMLLAVVATIGRVLVPIAVQQAVDRGIGGRRRARRRASSRSWSRVTALGVVLTGVASALMTARLFRAAETGLATLRTKAFRHVHDLPVLTQNTERRGALVSRVTSDVDQVSQFLVFGGVIAVVSVGQILIATVVMLFYSWQLTLVVWLCFLPLFLSLRYFQRRLSEAYATVRRQVGALLSAISEPVVGAARGPQLRRRGRAPRSASTSAVAAAPRGQQPGAGAHRVLLLARRHLRRAGQRRRRSWSASCSGGRRRPAHRRHGAGLRLPGHAVRRPGADGHPGADRRPERLRRLAPGHRHPRHARPTSSTRATRGTPLPERPARGRLRPRHAIAYPGGRAGAPRRRRSGSTRRTQVAVVGETGSGKTTLAKLLTRLMDPDAGHGPPRRRRPARGVVRQPARARGARAAGGLPLRRARCGRTSLRPPRRRRRRPCSTP